MRAQTRGNVFNVVRENLTNVVCSSNKRKFSASSFYPGRDDTTHPLVPVANFKTDDRVFFNPNVDDLGLETEEDDDNNDEEEIVELALKNPAKFAQVMATEVSL